MHALIIKRPSHGSGGWIKAPWSESIRFWKINIHISNVINTSLSLDLTATCGRSWSLHNIIYLHTNPKFQVGKIFWFLKEVYYAHQCSIWSFIWFILFFRNHSNMMIWQSMLIISNLNIIHEYKLPLERAKKEHSSIYFSVYMCVYVSHCESLTLRFSSRSFITISNRRSYHS